jgi:hypothetical protein
MAERFETLDFAQSVRQLLDRRELEIITAQPSSRWRVAPCDAEVRVVCV